MNFRHRMVKPKPDYDCPNAYMYVNRDEMIICKLTERLCVCAREHGRKIKWYKLDSSYQDCPGFLLRLRIPA